MKVIYANDHEIQGKFKIDTYSNSKNT